MDVLQVLGAHGVKGATAGGISKGSLIPVEKTTLLKGVARTPTDAAVIEDIGFDKDGNFYVLQYNTSNYYAYLKKYDSSGAYVASYQLGDATQSGTYRSRCLAVTDTYVYVIWKNTLYRFPLTIATATTVGLGAITGVPSTSASTAFMSMLVDEADDSLYVTTSQDNYFRKYRFSTGAGLWGLDVPNAYTASLEPHPVFSPDKQYIYLAHRNNSSSGHNIQKISKSGSIVKTLASAIPDNNSTSKRHPLSISPEGTYLFICDFFNDTIKKIETTNLTIVETWTEFVDPHACIMDKKGDLYIFFYNYSGYAGNYLEKRKGTDRSLMWAIYASQQEAQLERYDEKNGILYCIQDSVSASIGVTSIIVGIKLV